MTHIYRVQGTGLWSRGAESILLAKDSAQAKRRHLKAVRAMSRNPSHPFDNNITAKKIESNVTLVLGATRVTEFVFYVDDGDM